MLIGIAGRAEAGKDSVAEVLVKNYEFRQLALADKVREFLLAVDPWVSISTGGGARWERLSDLVRTLGWDRAKRIPEVRRLLQRTGTEGGRNVIGIDVWIKLAFGLRNKGEHVVISDVRFLNEAMAIIQKGGHMIWVDRPDLDPLPEGLSKHSSEQLRPNLDIYTAVIVNDRALEDLTWKTADALVELRRGRMTA